MINSNYMRIKKSKYTYMLFLCFLLSNNLPAQKPNWHNLDYGIDSIMGISTEKAYSQLLLGKRGKTVIVAVIDGGVDTKHQDLKGQIWTNTKEIEGNGVDDDKNGYVDDINGWNFLGTKTINFEYENFELTRIVRRDMMHFANINTSNLPAADLNRYNNYMKNKAAFETSFSKANEKYFEFSKMISSVDTIVSIIGKANPVINDFEKFNPDNAYFAKLKKYLITQLENNRGDFGAFYAQLTHFFNEQIVVPVKYHYNLEYDLSEAIGSNTEKRFYGNNDVKGPGGDHGTHVAGIIAGVRNNNIGINGIADNVKIMCIRVTPNGDERDIDVANAIIYAVDNGAKIINMSFGKAYSWNKKIVDDAVKYAMRKNVLIVHAAGNENKNLEAEANYPNRIYEDNSGIAQTWIEVGASGWKNNQALKAPFSNYGKTKVDVFAPGVSINSTIQNSGYEKRDGTSMAAPVVSGIAALLFSYYPKLTAEQVKEIIMKTVVEVPDKINITEDDQTKQVSYSYLCVSGGIVNAYKALQLAEKF